MATDPLERLTDRQKACLRLVRDGRNTKEIAQALDASASAIDKSIKLAMAKIGVNRRSEAARLLAAHEADRGYQPLAPPSPDLSTAPVQAPSRPSTMAGQDGFGSFSVREAQRPYRIDVAEPSVWRQDPSSSGADHNLGWWQIVTRVILIALASMLLAGAALNLVGSTGLLPRHLFPQQ
jgi:DNA-binding CsgD family transcriptional regulator